MWEFFLCICANFNFTTRIIYNDSIMMTVHCSVYCLSLSLTLWGQSPASRDT